MFRSTVFGLAALLLASPATVSAQYAERPADRLSRYLRELAADPTSVQALIGAGQAAIDVGDGNAALGFFARADERSPRNGQIKAGLARALLMVDNPREALKMFDAARSLGVPDAQLAPDRALAYDLKGENKRAQQDYALALSYGANDEVTKRYALSLGITGDRDRALQLLDPLLYKRDQGAWRARAFVLALTGDVAGASRITHQVMPERMAETMDPFLQRLAGLNSAQKAAAVHLGEMPSNMRAAAAAPIPGVSPAPMPTPVPAPPPSRNLRHDVARTTSNPASTPAPPPRPSPAPVQVEPVQYTLRPAPNPAPSIASRSPERGDLDAIMRDIRTAAARGTSVRTRAPVRVAQATPKPSPAPKLSLTPKTDTKNVPADAEVADCKPVRVKGRRVSAGEPCGLSAEDCKPMPRKGKHAARAHCDPTDEPVKQAALKKKPEPPKNPARVWIQVAGGANAQTLPKEWSSVAGKAAELKGKGPWMAKNHATHRLLAGPFKSEEEAQAAVAKLRKAGVGAFRWSSDEGEPVEKIGGK